MKRDFKLKVVSILKDSSSMSILSEDIIYYLVGFMDLNMVDNITPLPNMMGISEFQQKLCKKNYAYYLWYTYSGDILKYTNMSNILSNNEYVKMSNQKIYKKNELKIRNRVEKLLILMYNYDKGAYSIRKSIYTSY